MKNTKKSLMTSVVALLLCFSMLLGATYAWFTDVATSNSNVVQTGNLDAEMYWSDTLLAADSDAWQNAEGVPIFTYDNWEPGYTDVKYIKVKNAGNLAFQWRLCIEAQGNVSELADVIDVYYINPISEAVTTLSDKTTVGVLSNVIDTNKYTNGVLLPATEVSTEYAVGETILAIALHMHEDAGNHYKGKSIGDGFSVRLIAAQFNYEEDSFDNKYDEAPEWPGNVTVGGNSASATVEPTSDYKVSSAVSLLSSNGVISAEVPAGVMLDPNVTKLTLNVSDVANSQANVTLSETEASLSIDVHIDGVAADNDVVMAIGIKELLPVGLNMGNYRFYHVENGQTVAMFLLADGAVAEHNNYEYDPATGDVVLYLKSFSEVAMIAEPAAWEGNRDYSWYTNAVAPVDGEAVTEYIIANADQLAALSAIVGGMDGQTQDSFDGKTVKLVADINLGDKESENNPDIIFYPIGYNSDDEKYEKTGVAVSTGFYNFCGTFDGNGHTVSNFYQNTWEMKGDHNWYDATLQYYRDGMGLFGRVYGGTVKNLTVKNFSSDGEITTTGTIAAYADGATFENISIFNCNPRVYNIGNGGIVGCVGWYAKDEGLKTTFTNITVDNSNKISALWGSYDVACGGIVGQYYPTSGQTSAGTPKNAGIDMKNCHVAAQMDVYNDVCANYQYYAYRYAGMLIGSVRENETIGGHVYPKMDGITASGCTVHFGTWNDYYYCELVANSLASYTHDHQFSRLEQVASVDVENMKVTSLKGDTVDIPTSGRYNYVVVNGEHATENASCYHFVDGKVHNHDDYNNDGVEDYETVNGESIRVENNRHIYLEFNNLVTGYGWGVTSKGLSDFEGTIVLDKVYGGEPVEKFKTKFTGDFLYRVGNQNTISLGSLFAALDQETYPVISSGVHVKIEKLNDDMNVSGEFNANTNSWEQGTIQFSGTGVVMVTIQDYNYCTPTELILEVVDAENATGATNATSNNVVLLNDCGFGSLEVSGGYTLYGNGFTMTCGSDSAALDMGYAFVTLNNGTLDNVQIVCPNFDYAVLYKSNMTESGNRSETTDKTRYFNVKSGVMVSGNSQILNSRISGARAAVNVAGGNCVIDNSRIELGAVASLLVGAANSVTLRDVTLVQKPTASTYDSSKTLMGFSVLVICNADGTAATINLDGELIQNAWVDESDKQYVPSDGQSLITSALKQTDYLHDLNDDGIKESLNLGIAYMPQSANGKVDTSNINDNRINKDAIPYDYADVSSTKVYSYKNTSGTSDDFVNVADYVPNKQGDIITVTYSDTADGLESSKSFGTDGWVYELNVDLDKLSGYALDFSKLSISINGVAITDYKVNGNAKPAPVAVTAGGTNYTLTATVNGKECTVTFKVTGIETTKESPSLVASNYEAALLVGEAGSTLSKDTWHGAAPALVGIQIKYWSVAEKQYKIITLSDYTPTTAGKQNGTNTTWTYSPDNGDFTLTLTGGQVHSSNNVSAIPVVCNSKLYFAAATSSGLVNYGNGARTIPVSYSFKDNNGGTELTFSHTWSIECANGNTAYDYSDFMNGTSKTFTIKSSNGSVCVTPDTLVMLEDGTQKRIDAVTYEDQLLVWNFFTGDYDVVPSAIIFYHEKETHKVLKLNFGDGTSVKVITNHGFFDVEQNQFVFIDEDNVESLIGHHYVKVDGDTSTMVELVGYEIFEEYTASYSIQTAMHNNFMVEGLFSITMPHYAGWFDYFEIGEDMKYDEEKMQADIEKYGLYTYEDFAEYVTYEQFIAFNGPYLKVLVGRGVVTYEQIIELISMYVPQNT